MHNNLVPRNLLKIQTFYKTQRRRLKTRFLKRGINSHIWFTPVSNIVKLNYSCVFKTLTPAQFLYMYFTIANLNTAKMSNKLFFSLSFVNYFLCLKKMEKIVFYFFGCFTLNPKLKAIKKLLKKNKSIARWGKGQNF